MLDELELVLHLVLELDEELLCDCVTYGRLGKLFGSRPLGLSIDLGELLLEEGRSLLEGVGEGSLEALVRLLLRPLALALADVRIFK